MSTKNDMRTNKQKAEQAEIDELEKKLPKYRGSLAFTHEGEKRPSEENLEFTDKEWAKWENTRFTWVESGKPVYGESPQTIFELLDRGLIEQQKEADYVGDSEYKADTKKNWFNDSVGKSL